MMTSATRPPVIALDVGDVRTGVAYFDGIVRIAQPITVVPTSTLGEYLHRMLSEKNVSTLVVGLPRNMSGETTPQTARVREIVDDLGLDQGIQIVYQDESLTSVAAESLLSRQARPQQHADAVAASIILDDYLRSVYSD